MNEIDRIHIFLDEKNVPNERKGKKLSLLERVKIQDRAIQIAYKLGYKRGLQDASAKGRVVEDR